jgi:hypothetical protein
MSLWEFDQAREVLRCGLERSRRKFPVCERLGEVEWRAGKLSDAVYWWAQAVHCQESLPDHGTDVGAYLYLSCVAIGVEEADAGAAFLRRVDSIRAGQIRFESGTEQSLIQFASRERTPDVREVLTRLRMRYLQ